jgi:chemotaxis response regulator CheB
MRFGLLASDADAAPLREALGSDFELRWQASTLDEALSMDRARPVDALIAATPALRGATARLRGVRLPVLVCRVGHASDDAIAYQAMDSGAAYTFSLPPVLDEPRRLSLLRALRLAASPALPQPAPAPARACPAESCPIVAIGASTGGPPALSELLRAAGQLPAAILIVQHIDPFFTADMAGWLGAQSGTPVDLSSAALQPRPGRAILAATSEHLVATPGGALRHAAPLPHEIHHPSVDALFFSLASHAPPGIAVLLTGMGRDGADGLLALRKAGWRTVAQDASTSAVDGMPRAARELGAAQLALPLPQIGPYLRKQLGVAP